MLIAATEGTPAWTPHHPVNCCPRRPIAPLAGRIAVPGDKSISHRALMFGALAVGETRITGLLEGEDVLRTAAAMRALGAEVAHDPDGTWRVAGRGIGGLTEPEDVLDMGNSGTAARLLCGILASHPIFAVMTGDASLRRRPMRRVIDPLSACGARFASREGGRLPLAVEGAARGAAARLPRAGAVGAGEVGGAAVRPERARHHPRRGTRGDPRPQRKHAAPFRRHGAGGSRRPQPDHHAARPAGAARRRRRGAGRSVLGGVPGRGGAAGAGVAADHAGRRAEPARCGLFAMLAEMGADIVTENRRIAGRRAGGRSRRHARPAARRGRAVGARAEHDRRISRSWR